MASKRKSVDGVKNGSAKSRKGLAKDPEMVPVYKSEKFRSDLKNSLESGQPFKHEFGAILHNTPFTCCVLPNFLNDEGFLEALKEELLEQTFHEKNNDLYKFSQTNDLRHVKTPHVSALRSFLTGEVCNWLKEITGIPLSSVVDISASRYEFTDVLLCHDDELEGRRIAYMLYLVPPWECTDGGALELFNTDDSDQPKDTVKSIWPQWNNFVFFEVTPKSFHQVAEILSPHKSRLSVSGWFYGPPFERPPVQKEPLAIMKPFLANQTEDLVKWINPSYLELATQLQIRTKFEEDSEIELSDFIKEDIFKQIEVELRQASTLSWQKLGPPNKRNLSLADETSPLSTRVRGCLELFRSEQFFLLLSSLTGLNLHPLAGIDEDDESEGSESKAVAGTSNGNTNASGKNSQKKTSESRATCHVNLTQWQNGSYSLLYDREDVHSSYGLDVRLFFNCLDWHNDMGGYVSYVVKGEDEELLTVCPAPNALALVYSDVETVSFVKYVNSQIASLNSLGEFQAITGTYLE